MAPRVPGWQLLLLTATSLSSSQHNQRLKSDGSVPGLSAGPPHPNSILAPTTPLEPRLPEFLSHPRDSFVTKTRPTTLNCTVVHSQKAYFSCNGEALSKSAEHSEQDSVDSGGRVLRVLSVQIDRTQVEEYFGEFSCQCDAWSALGQASSRAARVATGYLNKEFEVPPYSQSVTLGSQVELRCHPPSGQPKPRIYWMKNKMEIQVERDSNFLQSADGHLILVQVKPLDVGNYTCVAENMINRRVSPPARLDIFVDGGWSSWAPWTDCDVRCGKGSRRRQRVCNNPSPSLNGVYCPSEGEQSQTCSSLCQQSGGWSPWSSWSSCSPMCSHSRRRSCTRPPPSPGGQYCRGRDQASAACSSGMCRPATVLGDSPDNSRTREAAQAVQADLALLIGLAVALAVFCCVSLVSIRLIRRKGQTSQSIYNMNSLSCRAEFMEKPDPGAGSKKEPNITTNFSFPGARRKYEQAEDKQVLQLDFPTSATSSPHPEARRPPAAPPAPLSPSRSEHQYDVPFSHLLPRRHNKQPPGGQQGYSTTPGGQQGYSTPGIETSHGDRQNLTSIPLVEPAQPPWTVSDPSLASSPGSELSSGFLPPSSLLPPGLDPDSFTFCSMGAEGGRLSLPDWGVSLLVPKDALKPGYIEDVFLAVLLEPQDLPSLSSSQTSLSPVVLAGPPGLSFSKPVVLSFGHSACLQQDGWEIGVYHCDSIFSEGSEQSWVKLVTVGQESPSCPILTHLDFSSCFLLTDFLSRFCLVGQSKPGQRAARNLSVVMLGSKHGQEFLLEVHVTGENQASLQALLRTRQKLGMRLLHKPRPLKLEDGAGDLCLKVVGCGPGWSVVRPRKTQQELNCGQVWAGLGEPHFNLALEHQDPSVQQISLDFTVFQKQLRDFGQTVSVCLELSTLSSPTSRTSACSSLVASSSGCSSLPSSPLQAFTLPTEVRTALCSSLDGEVTSGVDWRSLAVGLRLGRHLDYFRTRPSPTDCLLTLWESQQNDQAAITDLLNIVRVIGKPEVAAGLEKKVGSWV